MTVEKSDIAKAFNLPDPPQVTDVDTVVINSGPAFFSNKMYATMTPQGMRLTFAELNPASETPAFRAAIFMGYQDIAALADLLLRQLSLLQSATENTQAGDSGEPT
jgi:hypothetical protein